MSEATNGTIVPVSRKVLDKSKSAKAEKAKATKAKAEGPISDGKESNKAILTLGYADPKTLLIYGFDKDLPDSLAAFADPRATSTIEDTLLASIQTYGVLEPVEVVQHDSKLIVLNGRQRVRAARALEIKEIAYAVKDPKATKLSANTFVRGSIITANETSKKDELLVKVAKLESFLKSPGADTKLAAKTFGVSDQTIRNWQALANCVDEVKVAIVKGLIPITAAMKIGRLKKKQEQLEVLNELLADSSDEEADSDESTEGPTSGGRAKKKKKKVSTNKAASAVAKKKKPLAEPKYDVPGKRELLAMAKHAKCNTTVSLTLLYVLGYKSAKSVPSLVTVMEALAEG